MVRCLKMSETDTDAVLAFSKRVEAAMEECDCKDLRAGYQLLLFSFMGAMLQLSGHKDFHLIKGQLAGSLAALGPPGLKVAHLLAEKHDAIMAEVDRGSKS
jgi:hypothetical protein